MGLDDDRIRTPALLLDDARLRANLARLRDRLVPHRVTLRPHLKTAKSVEVAALASPNHGPITVSTLREAEAFHAAGFADILYAVAITPAKLPAAEALVRAGCALQIIVDSPAMATALGAYGLRAGIRFDVLIEIDSDAHRSGVPPQSSLLLDTAAALNNAGTRLLGVMTHGGGAYDCATVTAIRVHAELERTNVVAAAERLRAAGHECPVVSLGSTPTAMLGERFDGVTEVRAGAYMFQDLMQRDLGVCAIDDIAVSVLCSVIGYQSAAAGGGILIDAGWMAMSQDRAPKDGYGVVCGLDGLPIAGLVLAVLNQEHGIIRHRDGAPVDASLFPVGTRLRLLPHHACATAGQHDAFQLLRDGQIVDRWIRHRGW